ncbi:hypothetical protein TNCV_1424591 [Trichonephila clavipes]|nr:hypothetical protein TNCV_1424591 [Trichonephila clavipes]
MSQPHDTPATFIAKAIALSTFGQPCPYDAGDGLLCKMTDKTENFPQADSDNIRLLRHYCNCLICFVTVMLTRR